MLGSRSENDVGSKRKSMRFLPSRSYVPSRSGGNDEAHACNSGSDEKKYIRSDS